jgi:hypothetical protein
MNRSLLLCWLVIACRSQNPSESLPSRDAAEIAPSTAAVSLELLPDPDSPDVKLGPGEEYVSPHLGSSNPTPVYPSHLVVLRLKPHTVVLRVTFDERGRAAEIARSPVGTPTEGEHRPAFEEAAKAALERWHCSPAQIRKFRPGPDADGDGKPDFRIMQDRKILKSFFDVSFSFEVIDGVPVVKAATSK